MPNDNNDNFDISDLSADDLQVFLNGINHLNKFYQDENGVLQLSIGGPVYTKADLLALQAQREKNL
ncbi:MAG: hypothetical protein JXQ74_00865 [Alphaproteobacteria bacterium]|nr:hypothetical protein [Alphaproteobacteria bacterium]